MNRREFLAAAAGLPFALRSAPAAFAGGGQRLALVTADAEARIIAVDVDTGRIRARIPTLPDPRSIEGVKGRLAVVAHTAEGAVSLVDGSSHRVARVLRAFRQPRYTASSPDGRFAYVTDSERGEVVTLDIARGRAADRVEVGGPARHLSVDPTGRRLWVALGSKAEVLAILDASRPSRLRLLRLIRPPFLAHDVGFAPDGKRVWVTSGNLREIAVYGAQDGEVLFTLPGDAPPQHVTFVDRRVYVTSGDDGTLRMHRVWDGRLLGATAIPAGSYNVQQGFGLVLTPSLSRGTLCVLDAHGMRVGHWQVARSSHDVCFIPSL